MQQPTSIVSTANLDALALCCCEPDQTKASLADGTREAPVGEVVAMPIRSLLNPGVFFEPEVIALMSEAFEVACKALRDAGKHEVVREVIARRIMAAASLGERDPVRLRAAALAARRVKLVEASSAMDRDVRNRSRLSR